MNEFLITINKFFLEKSTHIFKELISFRIKFVQ